MEVSGQLHVSAFLPLEKEQPEAAQAVKMLLARKKYFFASSLRR
jgi:hypothetical protein